MDRIMFNLEYLIIYKNDGIPCFSRCFGDMCKIAMKDDALFSAFLASLVSFASLNEENRVDEIELEGMTVKVEYSEEKEMHSLIMADLQLIFLYNNLKIIQLQLVSMRKCIGKTMDTI